MRDINKFVRRKLGNKKQFNNDYDDGYPKQKTFVKPSKYYKQEIERSIEEYYKNK
jgi:hypothetical protein